MFYIHIMTGNTSDDDTASLKGVSLEKKNGGAADIQ